MTRSLQDRLSDAKNALDRVDVAILRSPGRLPLEVEEGFRRLADFRGDIDHWSDMVGARTAAFQLMDGLETKTTGDNLVPLGSGSAKFAHARFLGVVGYLGTTWGLADRLRASWGAFCVRPPPDETKRVLPNSCLISSSETT